MKSRIMFFIAVVAAIAFVALLLAAVVVYPTHIGEPSYYHVARVDCLVAAVTCAFISFVAAITVHF